MALVDCPECTSDVSEYADSCPHCGYPFKDTDGNGSGGVVLEGIDIGFNSWAFILLKAGIAAVPVVIVLYLVLGVVGAMFIGGLFGG